MAKGEVSFGAETLEDNDGKRWFKPFIEIRPDDGSVIVYKLEGVMDDMAQARDLCGLTELALRADRRNYQYDPNGLPNKDKGT